MANIFPIDRAFRITSANHGNFAEFGPAGEGSMVGTWLFHWVPDSSFVGALGIVGRAYGQKAKDNDVPFVPIPFAPLNINGVVPAAPFVYISGTIDGNSIIQVPSNGLSVAVLIDCTEGFGWLYSWDNNGTANSA